MPKIIRASVVQACTAHRSLDDTLDKLDRLTRLARDRDGSQLCVFPEAFVGGYPRNSTFEMIARDFKSASRDEFAVAYHAGAIEVPSPAISRMESVSRETGVFLVVGIIERDGGTLYCTAVFIDPAKGYVAKHRKLVPTGTERLVWGQGGASTLPIIEKNFGSAEEPLNTKITATICWENYMPLVRTFYYSKGTQLYCAPTADPSAEWQSTVRHIALEGRCFVLSCCQYSEEKDTPEDYAVHSKEVDPNGVVMAGGSVIISPLGKVLAGPLRGGEGVATAELDLDDIVRGKFDLDVCGHYARHDVFKLEANVPSA